VIPLRDSRRPRRRPWATWALAAGCVGAFAWELSLGERLPAELARWAASPREIATLERPWSLPLRLVAAMFLHGGWLHLAGNLAFLLVFGDDVEVALRPRRYLALYFVSGLVATLAQAGVTPASPAPLVGASGAIAGVLGTFLVLFPKAKLSGVLPLGCLLLPMRTRAFLFLPGWFLLQLASALVEPLGGGAGVAWYAHLAGFAAGPIVYWLLPKR
jgi:membrane associated rhomboid family serine protease